MRSAQPGQGDHLHCLGWPRVPCGGQMVTRPGVIVESQEDIRCTASGPDDRPHRGRHAGSLHALRESDLHLDSGLAAHSPLIWPSAASTWLCACGSRGVLTCLPAGRCTHSPQTAGCCAPSALLGPADEAGPRPSWTARFGRPKRPQRRAECGPRIPLRLRPPSSRRGSSEPLPSAKQPARRRQRRRAICERGPATGVNVGRRASVWAWAVARAAAASSTAAWRAPASAWSRASSCSPASPSRRPASSSPPRPS